MFRGECGDGTIGRWGTFSRRAGRFRQAERWASGVLTRGESAGGGTGIRTRDTTIFSRVLYQLSYPAGETWKILRYAVGAIKRRKRPRV